VATTLLWPTPGRYTATSESGDGHPAVESPTRGSATRRHTQESALWGTIRPSKTECLSEVGPLFSPYAGPERPEWEGRARARALTYTRSMCILQI
jgi:hypothetical protein